MCALLDTVRFGGNSTPSGRLTAMAQLHSKRLLVPSRLRVGSADHFGEYSSVPNSQRTQRGPDQ